MNQIETQVTKLRLYGMINSYTALHETRKPHELSFTGGAYLIATGRRTGT